MKIKIFGAKKIKKAFTLIELLISTVIVGILATIMFQVYITISNISVRVESEKLLQTETMFLVQNLQNLSDSQQINFSGYYENSLPQYKLSEQDLKDRYGVVDKLYFTGGKYSELFLSGSNCEITKNCEVVLGYDEAGDTKYISLTDSKKIYFTSLKFKLTTYSGSVIGVEDSFQQGFGVFGQVYISKYNPSYWPLNVKSDIQTFFSIR